MSRVLRTFAPELRGKVDPRLFNRITEIYEMIYQLQNAPVPAAQVAQVVQQQLQAAGLIGALGQSVIGQTSTPDPQLAQIAIAPGTGTVTSVTASSGAAGFALAATPSPIVGAGNIAFSITNAATARSTLGISEFLAATVSVDLNSTTYQDLYTVPSGSFVTTRIVARNASTSLVALTGAFQLRESSTTNLIMDAIALNTLITSTLYMELVGYNDFGIPASQQASSGNKVQARNNTALGSPATVVIDLFGYLH